MKHTDSRTVGQHSALALDQVSSPGQQYLGGPQLAYTRTPRLQISRTADKAWNFY